MAPGARRIGLYHAALRGHRRASRLTQAVIDGIALGVFDRATLNELSRRFYDDATERVDGQELPFQDERSVRQGLFDWERAAVDASFPPGARVIVTSAGAGREILALRQAGFDVTGFEPHAGLAAAGADILARLGHPECLRPSAFDVWPDDAGAADAVVIGWGSYMLIPGRERRIALLRGARGVLPVGGPLLVSFSARREGSKDLAIVAGIAQAARRLRGEEPVQYGDWLAPMFVHLFSEAELRSELSAAGFAVWRYAAAPYGHALARAT